jgi:FkbM family methyltransferase
MLCISRDIAAKLVFRLFPQLTPHYFKSYSQFGEDVVMRSLLDGRAVSYIDVGSGHPIKGSNTYFLYKQGARGILVDPIEQNIQSSKKSRARDTVIHAGVASSLGELKFFLFEPYQFSTFDKSISEQRVSEGIRLVKELVVPLITLESLNLYSDPKIQSFLCIDTEGFEMQVLKSNNFEKYLPDVIVIEDWARSSPNQTTEIFDFLITKGYSWHSRVGFSDIYIA